MPALNVIVQIALLPKGKAALGAGKRFVLRVNQLVPREFGLDAELLAARVARVIFLASVRGHVGEHLLPTAEAFDAV